MWFKPTKIALFGWIALKFFVVDYSIGLRANGTSFMLSSVQEKPYFYEFFQNILQGFLSELINETSQGPIKTFLQHVNQKSIIFSDNSLPRLDKNMTESAMSKKISKLCPSVVKKLVLDQKSVILRLYTSNPIF